MVDKEQLKRFQESYKEMKTIEIPLKLFDEILECLEGHTFIDNYGEDKEVIEVFEKLKELR